jgi:hypothetical protein
VQKTKSKEKQQQQKKLIPHHSRSFCVAFIFHIFWTIKNNAVDISVEQTENIERQRERGAEQKK